MRREMKKLILGHYQHLLENIVPPAAITSRAACSLSNAELFFSEDKSEIAKAREICMACPVRQLCADYYLPLEIEGIFAGLDQKQRTALRGGNPGFTFEELNEAICWQRDLKRLNAADFSQKYGVNERTYFRYRDELFEVDQAS